MSSADYFSLVQELNDLMAKAYKDLDYCIIHGNTAAEARANYKTALNAELLNLRENTKLPANLIPKVAEGSEEVMLRALDLDCAEVLYKAANEVVQLRKRQIDIIREQIAREHSIPRRENL